MVTIRSMLGHSAKAHGEIDHGVQIHSFKYYGRHSHCFYGDGLCVPFRCLAWAVGASANWLQL